MIEIVETNLSNVDPSLAVMAETAARYDAICILRDTFTQYTVAMVITGIVLGIIFTLLFQYTRRKAKAKIEAAEYARKLKELADELPEENPNTKE